MPKKILIVDDSKELRQLVTIALDFPDFVIFQAANANEALATMSKNKPDLIVLDIMMPGTMDGFQLCKYIKSNLQSKSIKVLLLTSRAQASDIKESIQVKADGYMVKPFTPMVLQNKVFELLFGSADAIDFKKHKSSSAATDKTKDNASLGFDFPPRPTSLINIQQESNKKFPDIAVVAHEIAADITLSAALLQTVNAPFYGLQNKVTSVSDAVNLIGLTRTLHLVTAVSIRKSMELPSSLANFWEDATKSAVMAASIAKYLEMDPNLAYLMGLFHDAAIPLMALKFPDYLTNQLEFQNSTQGLHNAEQAKYNMNHAMLGSLLARTWYLPQPLIEAIRLHHSVNLFSLGLDNAIINLITVNFVADNIAYKFTGDIDNVYVELEESIRKHLGLVDDNNYRSVIDTALDAINQE
ncbi:MAG: HDOD domain-containing protein [Methylococcaceae bacterium]|nr:MAG: HDOD domain-containing protein [Methylococcaceae bacterium]